MIIQSVELKNYRNYEELHLLLDENTNLFYGNNAQGKTNILEAIYLCATAKSHRGSKDRELIRFKNDESHIRVKLLKKDLPYVIDMHLKKNKPKGIAVNGVPIRKASELFGILNVVCFSPEDLNLIKDGPSARRKFLDMELCQLRPSYVSALVSYNGILLQKNKLLKEFYFGDPETGESMLDVYDEQQKRYGQEIEKERERFVKDLNDILSGIHRHLSGEKEELHLEYEKNEPRNLRKEELRMKTTLSGPHRDDLAIYVNGMDLRKYGSQGQQRTAALSLKLAEIRLVKQKTGDTPVLLLDDVLSELDADRQNKLLQEIQEIQTILTCTGVEEFVHHHFKIAKTMLVEEGRVTVLEELT